MGTFSGPFEFLTQLALDLSRLNDGQLAQVWAILHPGERPPANLRATLQAVIEK